eukprot:CAMPEP_0181025442 /NCGR_PEP_ID=MMETSP1070-20121207/3103_1 /TAXON_ID=265543 /ORGANISM="Minutocellus polymorphus, Strain NH13" /LENGTH=1015 /DNA_ID=CAMNT_0023102557 /DNA_START=2071 /DNA_END=5119 /DNA_ORIENTATION=-
MVVGIPTSRSYHNLPAQNGKGLPIDAKRMVEDRPYLNSEALYNQMHDAGHLCNINLARNKVVQKIETKQKEINRNLTAKGGMPKATARYQKEVIDKLTVNLDDLLANRGQKLKEKIDQYEKSNDYLDLIWIVDHDIDEETGEFSFIVWTTPKMLLLGQTIKESSRGTGLIQIEGDMTDGLYKVDPGHGTSKWKVGSVGTSDSSFCYWDMFDGVFTTEDSSTVDQLFLPAEQAMTAYDVIVSRVLKDGGSGLEKACLDRAWLQRTCLAHAARFPGCRGAGYRGTMGSLIRYLVTTLKLPLSVISSIMSHWISLTNLPKVEYYQAARGAFIDTWTGVVNKHVMDHYVHEYPQIGAGVTFPGQGNTTNGLEKTWFWKKLWADEFAKQHPNEPRLIAVLRSAGKRCARFLERRFQTEPNHNASTWNQLLGASLRKMSPDDALSSVYYSLVDGRLLTHKEAVGHARDLGGVVMYRPSLSAHKNMVREAKKVATSIGGGHSDLSRLQEELLDAGESDLRAMSREVRMEYYRILGDTIRNQGPERKAGQGLREYLRCHGQRNEKVKLLFQYRCVEDESDPVKSGVNAIAKIESDAESAIVCEIKRQLGDDASKLGPSPSPTAEEVDLMKACVEESKGKERSARKAKAETILNENPERERTCRQALGQLRQSFVIATGDICCLCSDFHRDQECRDSALHRLLENNKGCPADVKADTDNFIPDVRDRLLSLHAQEPFSDEKKVKEAYSLLPSIDPLYNKKVTINGVLIPATKGGNGGPATFGIEIALASNKLVVKSKTDLNVDVYVGDEVTKINGRSVVDDKDQTCIDEETARRWMAPTKWRSTGKGFIVICIRRHLRKGSPTGGAYGREVFDCRATAQKSAGDFVSAESNETRAGDGVTQPTTAPPAQNSAGDFVSAESNETRARAEDGVTQPTTAPPAQKSAGDFVSAESNETRAEDEVTQPTTAPVSKKLVHRNGDTELSPSRKPSSPKKKKGARNHDVSHTRKSRHGRSYKPKKHHNDLG